MLYHMAMKWSRTHIYFTKHECGAVYYVGTHIYLDIMGAVLGILSQFIHPEKIWEEYCDI